MPIEPISATLSILASVLSIASSVKQIMERRRIGREEALQRFLKEAEDKERSLLEDPATRLDILELTTISEKLLKQLLDEANQCERKHIENRKKSETKIDRDQADIDAAECMCGVLRAIIRYNKRKLPDNGPFKDWWDSYSCKL